MNVKVNIETMTLKIMDCDPFEGMILDSSDGKIIEMVLVDSSTPEDYEKDLIQAEKDMQEATPQTVSIKLEDILKAAEEQNRSV